MLRVRFSLPVAVASSCASRCYFRSSTPRLDGKVPAEKQSRSIIPGLAKGAAVIAFGALEGYAFGWSGMTAPQAVYDQMLFRSWVVMKLFLSAVGSSMVCQALLSKYDFKVWHESRFYQQVTIGMRRVVGGCLVLGAGMTVACSGPTIIPAQIGAGAMSAAVVAAGAISGAAFFAATENRLLGKPNFARVEGKSLTLDEKFGGSYASWALPMGSSLIGAAAMLEYLFPHAVDAAALGTGLAHPLLPIFAGLVVGLNQIPLRYLTSDGQGGSGCVMGIVATLSRGRLASKFQFKNFLSSAQFLYVYVGTLIGAYIAVKMMRDGTIAAPDGPNYLYAFVGGFLMLLGARIAHGCTCGHGISGFSELSTESIAGACAIFGGAIATAVAMDKTGFVFPAKKN